MPKTTFFLTALALTGLYLWRIHRTPHGEATAANGAGVGPGVGVEAPPGVNGSRIASGGFNALRY
jgi:hypothetical protein